MLKAVCDSEGYVLSHKFPRTLLSGGVQDLKCLIQFKIFCNLGSFYSIPSTIKSQQEFYIKLLSDPIIFQKSLKPKLDFQQ